MKEVVGEEATWKCTHLHQCWLLDDDGPRTQLAGRSAPQVHHDVTDRMHGVGDKVKHLGHTPQQPLLLLQ